MLAISQVPETFVHFKFQLDSSEYVSRVNLNNERRVVVTVPV